MKKIKTSILVKILAWVLIAVSGLGFLGSGLTVIGMAQMGFYENSLSDIRKEYYARYSDRYSALVLDWFLNDGGDLEEYFKDKNFKYGVIQADSYIELEKLNLSRPGTYVETNFEGEDLILEDMHVFQCAINDGTSFSYRNPDSLWGYYWINNTGSYWNTYAIDRYVYDFDSGIFYCKANDCYYPIPNVLLHLYESGNSVELYLSYDHELKGYFLVDNFALNSDGYTSVLEISCYGANVEQYWTLIANEPAFNFSMPDELGIEKGEWGEMFISNYKAGVSYVGATESVSITVEVSDENNVDYATEVAFDDAGYYSTWIDLTYENFEKDADEEEISISKDVRIDPDGYVRVNPKGSASTNYFVVSYLPETLSVYNDDWVYGDLYVKFEHVFAVAYAYRYKVITLMFISLLTYIATFVFLCCAAGHRKEQEGLAENWLNKVPLEIYGVVTVTLEVLGIWMLDELSYAIGDLQDGFFMILAVFLVLLMGLLLTAMGLELVTRIKLRTIFKRTICYWVFEKIFGICKKMLAFARENIGMVMRVSGAYVILCMVEFLLLALFNGGNGFGLLLLFAEKAVLFVVIIGVVHQLNKLKEAGKHVAAGDLEYKVSTENMFWDFKEHGEHLNSIGDGLSLAVDERMKSERFKTELITNVSHDIKTPLTSIINYVDLLQKEEIEGENVKEYLEVLARQSARLKKLLEDLLEASKASAGTLPVGFEVLEAGVFMVQTVGEFEEKTKAQQLELVIKKPEEPIYIRADGRHFWRVIDNLMNNICKYAQPGTRVYINLEATDKDVFITFRNTSRYALNISSEELMERFVRGDSSRNTEGSGLGLSIAQSLMELMHGKFELIVDGDLFKVVLSFARCEGE